MATLLYGKHLTFKQRADIFKSANKAFDKVWKKSVMNVLEGYKIGGERVHIARHLDLVNRENNIEIKRHINNN